MSIFELGDLLDRVEMVNHGSHKSHCFTQVDGGWFYSFIEFLPEEEMPVSFAGTGKSKIEAVLQCLREMEEEKYGDGS